MRSAKLIAVPCNTSVAHLFFGSEAHAFTTAPSKFRSKRLRSDSLNPGLRQTPMTSKRWRSTSLDTGVREASGPQAGEEVSYPNAQSMFRSDMLYAGFSWHNNDAELVRQAQLIVQETIQRLGSRKTFGEFSEVQWFADGAFIPRKHGRACTYAAGYAGISRQLGELVPVPGLSLRWMVQGRRDAYDPALWESFRTVAEAAGGEQGQHEPLEEDTESHPVAMAPFRGFAPPSLRFIKIDFGAEVLGRCGRVLR